MMRSSAVPCCAGPVPSLEELQRLLARWALEPSSCGAHAPREGFVVRHACEFPAGELCAHTLLPQSRSGSGLS